jgi:hypothetical protein
VLLEEDEQGAQDLATVLEPARERASDVSGEDLATIAGSGVSSGTWPASISNTRVSGLSRPEVRAAKES